jgi:AraC family transcriptional regulator
MVWDAASCITVFFPSSAFIPSCELTRLSHELAGGDASVILSRMATNLAGRQRARFFEKRISHLNRDFAMLRALNEEPREQPLQTLHAFAPEDNSDLRLRLQPSDGSPMRSTNTTAPVSCFRGGLPPRVVRRLHEHIDSNIDQRISVEALAKLANLSVCYFVRAFKQSVGVTPHDYLIRRRVERTMKLLSDTDMSLSEIALAAGFADQSHCARRFRQHVGMSPRDYRWSMP